MGDKPIARCEANDVEVYGFPFYVKPEQGMEPAYIFLQDHVYNFDTDEAKDIMPHLVRIEKEADLRDLGFKRNDEGIYLISQCEKPWLHGGKS